MEWTENLLPTSTIQFVHRIPLRAHALQSTALKLGLSLMHFRLENLCRSTDKELIT